MMIVILLIGSPLAAAALAALVRPYRRAVGVISAVLSTVSLGAALLAWSRVLGEGTFTAMSGQFRFDPLAVLLAVSVALVATLAAWMSPLTGSRDGHTDQQLRMLCLLVNVFVAGMLVAVTIRNLAIMWVAIESTTMASALLVAIHRTKASVEASWKYLVLGAVGIALAFAGTVLSYVDVLQQLGSVPSALHWDAVVAAAPSMHPPVLRLAFVFILIGYGTKAGIAPMHTWLPDAHSEAPASISALMSGVLLAVSTYAVMRWKAVVDAALASAVYSNRLLIIFGFLSLTIAAFSLVVQRSYKRMLAYSSVEHSGLIWLGLGFGPAGTFAALLHVANHALGKSMLFLLSGRILQRYGTTDLRRVSGLLAAMPVTAVLFAAGIFALIGAPPFGLFVSEIRLLAAGFVAGRILLTLGILALLVIAFIGMLRALNQMLFGSVPDHVSVGERATPHVWPALLCVGLLVALGLNVPGPLSALLAAVAEGR